MALPTCQHRNCAWSDVLQPAMTYVLADRRPIAGHASVAAGRALGGRQAHTCPTAVTSARVQIFTPYSCSTRRSGMRLLLRAAER